MMDAQVKAALRLLFASFPNSERADPDQTAMAYLMAVDGAPVAAVVEAVSRFVRGLVPRDRHTFLPSTAELAIEVRARVEMQRIREQLTGKGQNQLYGRHVEQIEKRPTKDERLWVGEKMNQLARSMATGVPSKPQPEAQSVVLKEEGGTVLISSALQKTLRDAAAKQVGQGQRADHASSIRSAKEAVL